MLLTGASGVVGDALLERFPNKHPSQLVCFVHKRPVAGHNFTALPADVSLPYLGLGRSEYKLLARRVSTVIHAAAITNVASAPDAINRVNVDGTYRILEFAELAGAAIHVLSTAFVAGSSRNAARDNVYQSSKVRAEEIVRSSGIPHSILRPSVVVGDSRTGRIARFQGFHFALGALMKGNFPVVPANANAFIDFLPSDYVADAIIAIVNGGICGEFWITAGPDALTTGEVVDACVDFCTVIGRPIERPRLVSADIVDRLVLPAFGDDLPPEIVKRLEVWSGMASHMSIEEPLPTSLPHLMREIGLPRPPDLSQALQKNLAYWAYKSRWAARK